MLLLREIKRTPSYIDSFEIIPCLGIHGREHLQDCGLRRSGQAGGLLKLRKSLREFLPCRQDSPQVVVIVAGFCTIASIASLFLL